MLLDCQREPHVCEMARSIYLLCPQGQAANGRNMSGNVVKLFQDHGPDFCEPNIRPDNYLAALDGHYYSSLFHLVSGDTPTPSPRPPSPLRFLLYPLPYL